MSGSRFMRSLACRSRSIGAIRRDERPMTDSTDRKACNLVAGAVLPGAIRPRALVSVLLSNAPEVVCRDGSDLSGPGSSARVGKMWRRLASGS